MNIDIENDDIIQLNFEEIIQGKIIFECKIKDENEFKEIKKNIYNILSSINLNIKNIKKMSNTNQNCIHTLTRGENSGKKCGKKCIEDTDYCKIHLKMRDNAYKIKNKNININNKTEEEQTIEIKDKEEVNINEPSTTIQNIDILTAKKLDNMFIITKNSYGNFVFGKTGLIFKGATEKYIVAKEGDNGSWNPLSDEDIELCKKFRLKYKIIETNDNNIINTKEYTKNLFKI